MGCALLEQLYYKFCRVNRLRGCLLDVYCIHALQQLLNMLASNPRHQLDGLLKLFLVAKCVKCWNAILDLF